MAITLGKLIRLLECEKPENHVCFDFGGMTPTDIDSYRGYYDQLAIGYQDKYDESMTVAKLLEILTKSVGGTFHGYKGGNYTMDVTTPVWAANYGECHSTAIKGLADCHWQTIIATEFEE